MKIEQQVAAHYGRKDLETTIVAVLAGSGKDPDRLSPEDLAGGDEFHLGWHPATVELARDLELTAKDHVLDIGSGIGGPARHFAQAHGCRVTGIDLTEEFVRAAEGLTRRCGLDGKVSFRQASALALPFDAATFDAATLIHVGMNIADKAGLFAQARRVLKAGGRFGIYEVMRVGEGDIPYPMPWADGSDTSFVERPDTYRELLSDSGFHIEGMKDRTEAVLDLAREMRERIAREGPPPFGLHLLMGETGPQRVGNIMSAVQGGILAPVQILARAA